MACLIHAIQPILDDPPSVIVLGLALMLSGVLLGAVAVACGDWAINAALRARARRRWWHWRNDEH